ncbi:MAG: hypothetical protein JXX14_00580 [Deltaproteobacteria bacterium]|nr:hypothetical protein [Deltaproteobacteria bacterium]
MNPFVKYALCIAWTASWIMSNAACSDDIEGAGSTANVRSHAQDDFFQMNQVLEEAAPWLMFRDGPVRSPGSQGISDNDGNNYWTGRGERNFFGPNGEMPLHSYSEVAEDYIVKFDREGNYLWHGFWGCGGDIAFDESNNIIIVGRSRVPWYVRDDAPPLHDFTYPEEDWESVDDDICALKITPDGEYLWHTFYGGTDMDEATRVAVTDDGNLLLTTWSYAPWYGPDDALPQSDFNMTGDEEWLRPDNAVLKLDSNGNYLSHMFFGCTDADFVNDMAKMPDGGFILAGTSYGSWLGPNDEQPQREALAESEPGWLLRLDREGNYLWHTFVPAQKSSLESVEVTSNGDIVVAGYSYQSWYGPDGEPPLQAFCEGSETAPDAFVWKINETGGYLWHTFHGACGFADTAAADSGGVELVSDMLVDTEENLVVLGQSDASWYGPQEQLPLRPFSDGYSYDLFVLKLESNGTYLWHSFLGGKGNDTAGSISLSPSGDLLISGRSTSSWRLTDDPPLQSYSNERDGFLVSIPL